MLSEPPDGTREAAASALSSAREFAFTDQHFQYLRRLVAQHAGISLTAAKRELVYGRITRRIRALGLSGFDAYCEILEHDPDTEIGQFINAITTNLTAFFRENHHFEFLGGTVVPDLYRRSTVPRIRIWSAGCSTGEEPYSIAMTLLEAQPAGRTADVAILATDIDTNVIATGAAGVYDNSRVEGIGAERLRRWFMSGTGGNAGRVRVRDELKRIIQFKPLNLMGAWPMKGPFDVIFCRNVVIYFDKETQRRLFNRYADLLAPHGQLVIGHSESLYNVSERFELTGRTIYRKIQ
ncbi:MAG: protein-glutamate O-methyltransferase CheR [Gammaproteobacteria bacterium]|nr:protein-glutamate O-methyltransferase CheR [Gammaproteobacteria bacterium]